MSRNFVISSCIRHFLVRIRIAKCFTNSIRRFRCEVTFDDENTFWSWIRHVCSCATDVSSGLAIRVTLISLSLDCNICTVARLSFGCVLNCTLCKKNVLNYWTLPYWRTNSTLLSSLWVILRNWWQISLFNSDCHIRTKFVVKHFPIMVVVVISYCNTPNMQGGNLFHRLQTMTYGLPRLSATTRPTSSSKQRHS